MIQSILQVTNLSKQYRLGEIGTGTLSHDLNRWWHKFRGKEDPYLKIGEPNDRLKSGETDYIWALKNINLTLNKGEVLGIIGKNGAGKSTLLKILSRITSPTTGKIIARGRIAALLEVGTGFHPELTGRENIFLNGAILGMNKKEISLKLDEIVTFAGIGHYLDTPIKRYSSGMKVRLGFAIAAHLEPDILIVDEVLAVGDAAFQKKCIKKMQDISTSKGRTIIFVSHNMASVQQLCTKGLVLENGCIQYIGPIENTINHYLKSIEDKLESKYIFPVDPKKVASIKSVVILDSKHTPSNSLKFCEPFSIKVEIISQQILQEIILDIAINDVNQNRIFTAKSTDVNFYFKLENKKSNLIQIKFDSLFLTPSTYNFNVRLRHNTTVLSHKRNLAIKVSELTLKSHVPHDGRLGLIKVIPNWEII